MVWLIDRFANFPEKIAFIFNDIEYSYGEFHCLIQHYIYKLNNDEIKPGNVVYLEGDYSPHTLAIFFALWHLGAVIVPVSTQVKNEYEYMFSITGVNFSMLIDDSNGSCDYLLTALSKDKVSKNKVLGNFQVKNLAGMVLFSSGTSGTPKGILYSLEKISLKFLNNKKSMVAIPFLSFDHFGGVNTFLSILSGLGTLVISNRKSVDGICSLIEKYKVQVLPTTPSFLNMMLAANFQSRYKLNSLQRITYGSELMSESVLLRLTTELPNAKFLQTYGLSEVGVLSTISKSDGSLWLKVGGVGVETKIVDGILYVKSNFGMEGYLNSSADIDAAGWFNTGDRVEIDGEYIKILGRDSDIINIGGHKVYPGEVENIVIQIPNIKDVAVFGEKNTLMGQIVVAKVSLNNPEAVDLVRRKIRDFCMSKMANFKVPSKVIIADGDFYTDRVKKIRREC